MEPNRLGGPADDLPSQLSGDQQETPERTNDGSATMESGMRSNGGATPGYLLIALAVGLILLAIALWPNGDEEIHPAPSHNAGYLAINCIKNDSGREIELYLLTVSRTGSDQEGGNSFLRPYDQKCANGTWDNTFGCGGTTATWYVSIRDTATKTDHTIEFDDYFDCAGESAPINVFVLNAGKGGGAVGFEVRVEIA